MAICNLSRRITSACMAVAVFALVLGLTQRFAFAEARQQKGVPVTAEVTIGYLTRAYPEPLPLSLLEPVITDKGVKGAEVGLMDNQTTGRLLGHDYTLVNKSIDIDGDVAAAARELLGSGVKFIVADLEADDLLAVSRLPEA
ncbi:MAG TPA: hypothetical protein PLD46_09700, partial [Hyphomicrobium sp.]|nr:hypothetical protein [Hyphomicrobium sp.]